MTAKTLLLAAAATFIVPSTAWTQSVDQAAATPTDSDAAAPADAREEAIVVTGTRRRTDDILGNVAVISGAQLADDVRPTIGETLASQPGVSASGSGPNASRPILRGQSGERIRILADGIGSLDVSTSSTDHPVAISPLTADSIEIVHGPAALVFGSSAIGGVVNVNDSRIPRRQPNFVAIKADATYGSAANEKLLDGAIDVAGPGQLVFHGDVSWSKNDDVDTGTYMLSAPLRRQAAASADPDIRALADLNGKLPDSAGRNFEIAGGGAWVDGPLNAGFSVSRKTALYGVPIRYSLDPAVEAESVRIDMAQTRYDARAEIPSVGFFKQIRLRGALADYHHDELAEDGSVGSSFFAKGGEGRVDLVQYDSNGWGGQSGMQYLDKKERVEGDEKYLPRSARRQSGLFTLQHIETGPWRIEAGARFERNVLSAEADSDLGNPDLTRRFNTLSLSLGGSYAIAPEWKIGANLARSVRAPSIDELFSNGPHGGTASFEVGDPDLSAEKSIGGEISLRHSGPVEMGLTIYTSRFSNFIYQTYTGAAVDNLPVYAFRQGQATYSGFEFDVSAPFGEVAGIRWKGEVIADGVRATIRNVGPAPLIPPLRIQAALEGEHSALRGRVELERAFAHNRTADLETNTPGYTLLNASLDWKPLAARPELTLSLNGNNLLDVEARRSTSLLKDYAPLPGRDIRVGARFAF